MSDQQPVTAAGLTLLREIIEGLGIRSGLDRVVLADAILAIEREAATPSVDNEATFSPTSGEPLDGYTCEDCGQERWRHRDGGAAYGYICPPPTDTGAER